LKYNSSVVNNRRQTTRLSRLLAHKLERPAGRRDIRLPSATQNSLVHEMLFLAISWTGLHLTSF